MNDVLETAVAAARAGGDVLMGYFRDGVQMRDKSAQGGKTYDLVSDADVESERVIGNLLRTRFPRHELLGEENLTGCVDADDVWIIDPLDGTNNFAHQIPHFAVSIGYYRLGVAEVAAVYNPARDEMYSAVRGGGAFWNGRAARVCDSTSLSQTLIGCGFYYDRGAMMQDTLATLEEFFRQDIHGIRRFGTASLDLCQVGCGYFGGFFEYKLSPWDFAAGRLFVEEAGGKISDACGNPLNLEVGSVVASNGKLHEKMIELTSKRAPCS